MQNLQRLKDLKITQHNNIGHMGLNPEGNPFRPTSDQPQATTNG